MLDDKYKIYSTEVKEKLKNVQNIAITTDMWSSDSQMSFISITALFIMDWKLYSLVISTSQLTENYIALNIANTLRTKLTEWQILDKIVTIVVSIETLSIMPQTCKGSKRILTKA